jgi:hypothetical protein
MQAAETMSETPESAEVAEFIPRRRPNYISLLDDVNRELRRFKDKPKFRDAIYRIYSRKDKQVGGEPLKTNWKIAKKNSLTCELRSPRRQSVAFMTSSASRS